MEKFTLTSALSGDVLYEGSNAGEMGVAIADAARAGISTHLEITHPAPPPATSTMTISVS